jgi:hypothetical protein
MLVRITCDCGAFLEAVPRVGAECPHCGRRIFADQPIQRVRDEGGFEMSEPAASAPAPPPSPEQLMASVTHQLEGLLKNTLLSVEHLRPKLTADEQERIKVSAERATAALGHGDFAERVQCLREIERAAGIIGVAMLRPS